jgi:hypothetical protein
MNRHLRLVWSAPKFVPVEPTSAEWEGFASEDADELEYLAAHGPVEEPTRLPVNFSRYPAFDWFELAVEDLDEETYQRILRRQQERADRWRIRG